MFPSKDYSAMTLDELVSAKKKLKSRTIPIALFVGFVVGVAVWSATHNWGFLLTIGLLLFAAMSGSIYSKKLKSVQAEISRRDPVG